jgi:hypothetical protein
MDNSMVLRLATFGTSPGATLGQVDIGQIAWVVGGILLLVVLTIVLLIVWIAPGAWAIGDAQQRGQTGCVAAMLFYLLGPLSALAWLVIRPRTRLIDRDPEFYTNADDAMSAASKLDKLGHWDAAIELYQYAAKSWPENHEFLAACLANIKEKQGLR